MEHSMWISEPSNRAFSIPFSLGISIPSSTQVVNGCGEWRARRLRVVLKARHDTSAARNLRPVFAATRGRTGYPTQKSATRSPSYEDALMILSNRASGF